MNHADDGPASPAARCVELGKSYGIGDAVVRALDGVNVEFGRGRFTAVMGPSGSGKSSLMHCMAGLGVPTSGRAFIGEEEVGLLDDAGLTGLRRERVGFVFQSFNLVPMLTAFENITLPADLAGVAIDRGWFDYLVGQLGIADRLSEGRSNRAIAERLFITEHTVEKHVKNILGTLRLPQSPDDHRRVLAVITYLNSQ